jgi:hypothetical protein
MKPFQIKDPEKVYTKEELQKDSPYPLFDDFYVGEDPKDIDIYNNYNNDKTKDLSQYNPLEEKYKQLLPEYIQFFAKSIMIGPNDNVEIDIDLTNEVILAIQLKHELGNRPSKSDIVNIFKKDVSEFYKKFGAERAIKALDPK